MSYSKNWSHPLSLYDGENYQHNSTTENHTKFKPTCSQTFFAN